jgi:hypothetical protein
MLRAYIIRLFICALRPKLTWADVITFMLGFFAPLIVWLVGEEDHEFRISTIRDEFLVGIIVLLVLRFICAPYLIWRELIAYVCELHRELDGKRR